jgi:chromosome segregation ATPase
VRSRPRPLLVLVAVASVGLSGCASQEGDEVEELRAELVARSEAEEELVTRIEALEEEVAAFGNDVTVVTRLDGVEDGLGRVQDTLTVLDDRLSDESAARQTATEEAEAAATDLRSTLAELQRAIDELRGETDELRTLYETLRDRLDRQQRG